MKTLILCVVGAFRYLVWGERVNGGKSISIVSDTWNLGVIAGATGVGGICNLKLVKDALERLGKFGGVLFDVIVTREFSGTSIGILYQRLS